MEREAEKRQGQKNDCIFQSDKQSLAGENQLQLAYQYWHGMAHIIRIYVYSIYMAGCSYAEHVLCEKLIMHTAHCTT